MAIMVVLLGGAVAPVWAQMSSEEPAFEKYADPQGRFSLDLPVGWQVGIDLFGTIQVGPEDPEGPRAFFLLRPGQEDEDLPAIARESARTVLRGSESLVVSSEGAIGPEGTAGRAVLEFERGGSGWRAVALGLRDGGGTVGFACGMARREDLADALPTLDRVIETFLTSVGFSVPAGWSSTEGEGSGAAYERYTDPSGGWSVVVPHGWVVRMLPARLLVAAESENADAFALLTVRRYRELSSTRERVDNFMPVLRQVTEQITPAGDGKQISDQPDVYLQEFDAVRGGASCRGELTVQWNPHSKTALYAYCQAEEGRYEQMLPILRRVLSSFRREATSEEKSGD